MRRWVILNEFGHEENDAKTFEEALLIVLKSQSEGWEDYRYIVNEEQFNELQTDGWCEGGLEIVNGIMTDVEEIEDADRIHELELEEEERLYRSAIEDAHPSTFKNLRESLLETWRELYEN